MENTQNKTGADQVLMSDGIINFSNNNKYFVVRVSDKDQALVLFQSLKHQGTIILDSRTNFYYVSNDDGGMLRNFEKIIAAK